MNQYDSILKEKKKREVVVEKKKKFPKVTISFILIILLLIVSYLIYYNNILNAREVFINNSKSILEKYSLLVKDIPVKEFNDGDNLVGMITYNEEIFNFNFIRNNNNLNFNVSSGDKYFNYFLVDDMEYANVSGVTSNINLNYNNIIKNLLDIGDKVLSIDNDKYIKSFYFDGIIPIVEVNLVMDTNYINQLLGLSLDDNYQVIVTMKNNAVMNTIEEIKIVINNISDNDRRVIFISSEKIIYKTKSNTYKFVLEKNNNDFVIKINRGEELYSILTGTASGESYKYTYQVIDDNYNIDVNVLKSSDSYDYEVINRKDDVEKKIQINLNASTGYIIDSQFDTFVDEEDEGIKDIYNQEFSYFKDKYLEFIK